MAVFVNGIGLCAPGLPDWLTGQSVLTNLMPYQPDVPLRFDRSRLPRNAARRASLTVCLALQAATEALDQAGIDTGSCSAVFACSGGNTAALDAVLNEMARDGWELDCVEDLKHTAGSGALLCIFSRETQP